MDRTVAQLEQNQFMKIFGSTDWDVYRKQERELLYKKVGLAIVGLPTEEHNREQRDHAKKVVDSIIEEDVHDGGCGDTWMSVVILIAQTPGSERYWYPVFRVPKCVGRVDSQHCFIDCIGRVNRNWNDFLENNKLPESEICYPRDGVYSQSESGEVTIQFKSIKSYEVMNVLDAISNTVARGSLAIAAASLAFPVPAPLVRAAMVGSTVTGIYAAARAADDQFDRVTHGQSVGLLDKTSFRNWVSIAAGVCGVRSALKSWSSLPGSAKVGVSFRAAVAVRDSVAPQKMIWNLTRREMLLHDVFRGGEVAGTTQASLATKL